MSQDDEDIYTKIGRSYLESIGKNLPNYEVVLKILLPVRLSVLGIITQAISEKHPGSVMRQQGEHLLFEVPIEKSNDENI
jgi:hypothetical protein